MEFGVEKENTYLIEGKVSWEPPAPANPKGHIESATLNILNELGVDTTSRTVVWEKPEQTIGELKMDGKLRTDVSFKKVEFKEHVGTVKIKITIEPF